MGTTFFSSRGLLKVLSSMFSDLSVVFLAAMFTGADAKYLLLYGILAILFLLFSWSIESLLEQP